MPWFGDGLDAGYIRESSGRRASDCCAPGPALLFMFEHEHVHEVVGLMGPSRHDILALSNQTMEVLFKP